MTVQPTRDQLRALTDKATPGPWENTWNGVQQSFDAATKVGESAWEGVGIVPAEYVREHDAEFVAAARTAVPQLLDQLDQAEAERDYRRRENAELRDELVATQEYGAKLAHGKDEAEARIQAVRDVHTGTVWPGVADKPICDACDQMWPCDTIRALD